MTNPRKRDGDRAEREISGILSDLLGVTIVRKLGAGRREDTGDLYGLDDWTIQVAAWGRPGEALALKPRECEAQQVNAGTTFGATAIRQRGAIWRFVQTPDQFATTVRELWRP